MKRGLFITLEGGDGAGKTTQIKRIKEFLNAHSYETCITREPGGTPEAEKIRNLLVQRDGGEWTPEAEVLLLFTARHMHIEHLIKPALEKGTMVVCDRFTDSTRAYQCYGHGLDRKFVEQINDISIKSFSPDLTFILDIPAREGVTRSQKHLASLADIVSEQKEDRFENLDIGFHERLREGYLEIAEEYKDRCVLIDATQDVDIITDEISEIILSFLKEKGFRHG